MAVETKDPKRAESSGESAAYEVVALVASAGGLSALSHVLSALPADFSAAIVVVQHLDCRHRSLLADILSQRTQLRVEEAHDANRLVARRSRSLRPTITSSSTRTGPCRSPGRSWCISSGRRPTSCSSRSPRATGTGLSRSC